MEKAKKNLPVKTNASPKQSIKEGSDKKRESSKPLKNASQYT